MYFNESIFANLQGIKTLQLQFPKWYMDKKSAIRDLIGFTGLSKENVCENIQKGRKLMADEWNAVNPSDQEQVVEFYKKTRNYIWDLAKWNYFHPSTYLTFSKIVHRVDSYSRVLDYGAGIGSLLILAWERKIKNLTYYDVEGYTSSFAHFRFKRRKMEVNMVEAKDHIDNLKGSYDVITCLDVLEHVINPTMHLERLSEHLAKGGKLFLSVSFGKSEAHPMHIDKKCNIFEENLGLQKVASVGGVVVYTKLNGA